MSTKDTKKEEQRKRVKFKGGALYTLLMSSLTLLVRKGEGLSLTQSLSQTSSLLQSFSVLVLLHLSMSFPFNTVHFESFNNGWTDSFLRSYQILILHHHQQIPTFEKEGNITRRLFLIIYNNSRSFIKYGNIGSETISTE